MSYMSAPRSAFQDFQFFTAQLLRPTTSVKNFKVIVPIPASSDI